MAELTEIRIDKWLWAARFYKTRSLSQEAVELGRVKLAGQRLKPSREVRIGDRLQIERGDEHYEIFVEKISSVRGPAPTAQTLYRETDASKEAREKAAAQRKIAFEPAVSIDQGRPTKRDGRKLRSIKASWE